MTRARDLARFANNQALSVDTDFDVGINSTTPAAKLDVRGNSVITGILTATSFSGNVTGDVTGNADTATNAQGLTGTPNITVNNIVAAAATFSGVVTYEDVTNVDSVGVITARSGVRILVGESLLLQNAAGSAEGSIECDGAGTNTDIRIRTNSTERLRVTHAGLVGIGTDNPDNYNPNADDLVVFGTGHQGLTIRSGASHDGSIMFNDTNDTNQRGIIRYIHTDDAMAFHTSGGEALRIDSTGRIGVGTDSFNDAAEVMRVQAATGQNNTLFTIKSNSTSGHSILNFGDDDFNEGRIIYDHSNNSMQFRTDDTERFRIDSRGSFDFSNGFMNETVNINSTARTGTQAVNLDDGMVHYFSSNSTGTWKPNFTMSAGNDINATIATGDVFSPTMIVAKGATTHFANAIQVDGSDVTPEFLGGAPSDGGGSGTFDIYSYTIIKTGDDTFKAFASVSNYE